MKTLVQRRDGLVQHPTGAGPERSRSARTLCWITVTWFAGSACGPAVGSVEDDSAAAEQTTESAEGTDTEARATDESGDGSHGVCAGLGVQIAWSQDGSPNAHPQCSAEPTACGGEIEGTWTIQHACGTFENPLLAICPEATWTMNDYDLTGTATFEGGRYELTTAVSWSATSNLPSACVAEDDCGELGPFGATCSDDGKQGCDCTLVRDDEVTEMGTYEVIGSTLRTTDEGERVSESLFCRVGDELTQWHVESSSRTTQGCSSRDDCIGTLGASYLCVPPQPPE